MSESKKKFLNILDSLDINKTIFRGVRLYISTDLGLYRDNNRDSFSHFKKKYFNLFPEKSVKRIEGLDFRNFRDAYEEQNGKPFSARGSINVTNWKGALFYIYNCFDLSVIEQIYYGVSNNHSEEDVDSEDNVDNVDGENSNFSWKNNQIEDDPIINLRLKQLALKEEEERLYKKQLQLLKKQMSDFDYIQS